MSAGLAAHPHVLHLVIALHPHVIRLAVKGVRALSATALAAFRRISVVTPTWQRRGLLTGRCVPSVAAQTWAGETEHVIVSDGPDPALDGVPGVTYLPAHIRCANKGVLARRHGAALATGELVAYLDDDNAWRPRHLELLAGAIAVTGAMFAYSQALCRNAAGSHWAIGCRRPVFGQIDTSLIVHRRELLDVADWEPSARPADWHLVDRWLEAGVPWVHVPEITLDYCSDGCA